MVTGVFLYTLLVTALYFVDVIPGVRKTQSGLSELLAITLILSVATAASWLTAMVLKTD